MRGVVQGMDPAACWTRFLSEGAGTNARVVRSTIVWIRGAFAAAAKREAKPGTARLVLIDAVHLADDRPQPTLEAFAIERGMEDFSAAEQLEAYAEALGPEPRSVGWSC